MSAPRPVEELGYEQARDELVEVVRSLETGSATLESSLTLWERGEALAARCQQILDGARARLDQVTSRGGSGPDGGPSPRSTTAGAPSPTEGGRARASSDVVDGKDA